MKTNLPHTIVELRAQIARNEAVLAQKRAARATRAGSASALFRAEHLHRRGVLEQRLADAVARVATSTALCEWRIQMRLATDPC
jgi:uncharacterized small protein (DUF1192 family)